MTEPSMSGQLLLGRYRLGNLIGGGGMAEVYEAVDLDLGRAVAVKIASPHFAGDPGFAERLRDEARLVSSLDHPRIVKLYDYGEANGRPILVMELVRGRDLRTVLREEKVLSLERSLAIVGDLLSALDHAHGRDILHRDVKPENVLLSRDYRAKLVDFGIARAGAESGVTRPGHVVGSVHYIAPERMAGMPATPASDLYSVGVILYQMLAGSTPFDGDSPNVVAAKQQVGAFPLPSSLRPGVPGWVDSVVQRALAPDPGSRYQSAAEMSRDIAALSALHSEGTTEMPVGSAAGGGLALTQAGAGLAPQQSRPTSGVANVRPWTRGAGTRASRLFYPLLVALLIAGAALGLGAASRDREKVLPPAAAVVVTPTAAGATPAASPAPAATPLPAPTSVPASGEAGITPPATSAGEPAPAAAPPGHSGKPPKGNGNKKR